VKTLGEKSENSDKPKKKKSMVISEKKLKEFLNKEVVILTSGKYFVRGILKKVKKWNVILEPRHQILLRTSIVGIRTVESIREDFEKKTRSLGSFPWFAGNGEH